MSSFKVENFGGMIPAVADELLPDNQAALSQNTWLYSGKLVGLPVVKELKTLTNPDTAKVYRLPESYERSSYIPNSIYMEFTHLDTDVVRAPVFGDEHDRYYWASPVPPPQYNTRKRIEDGDHPWTLGLNPPTVAPDLSVVGGPVRLADVRVASTTSAALNTEYVVGKVVDGVTLVAGDRILIKNGNSNGDKTVNGVRIVAASGAPARAADMDTSNEFVEHTVKVLEGKAQAGTYWECSNDTPPVVGTDNITFEETAALPLQVTRSYVYTWVTEYKEESAPSLPVIETGVQDGSWNLSNMQVPNTLDRGDMITPNPNAVRYITKKRIYRTITSTNGVATFFLVVELPCDQTSYNDTKTDDEVSQNSLLESFSWTPPPSDLQGLTMMWNGMIAGFRENEIWVCEPYRPHAWPAKYVQTLEFPIVGLGVANKTLVACTAGNPVTVNGAVPDNLNTARIAKFEPCLSRGSILSSPNGVVYISPNGLIMVGYEGAVNITTNLLTRDKWKEYTLEGRLRAAWLGEAYYAFGHFSPNVFSMTPPWVADPTNDVGMAEPWISKIDTRGARNGVLMDWVNSRIAFNTLTSPSPVMNVQNDTWTGEVFIIRDGKLYWLDISDLKQPVEPGIWRSKLLQLPEKKNIGAMRVYFKETPELPALNTVRNAALEQELAIDQWGLCRLYADGRLVLTRELRKSGELWKTPSGFTADFWQYEVETRLRITSIQAASSVKELASV